MKFTKMHGCGNDYIYVNCFEETVSDPGATAIKVSDRHFWHRIRWPDLYLSFRNSGFQNGHV